MHRRNADDPRFRGAKNTIGGTVMELRKATQADIDLLARNRLAFTSLTHNVGNPSEYIARTADYLRRHIKDDSLISFIAVDNGLIVSSCILSIYETLPVPSCPSGKTGLLLNVYTLEAYKRQKLAYKLLLMLIEEAKRIGVEKIQLTNTEEGYPLYKKLGFTELAHQMCLKLQQ